MENLDLYGAVVAVVVDLRLFRLKADIHGGFRVPPWFRQEHLLDDEESHVQLTSTSFIADTVPLLSTALSTHGKIIWHDSEFPTGVLAQEATGSRVTIIVTLIVTTQKLQPSMPVSEIPSKGAVSASPREQTDNVLCPSMHKSSRIMPVPPVDPRDQMPLSTPTEGLRGSLKQVRSSGKSSLWSLESGQFSRPIPSISAGTISNLQIPHNHPTATHPTATTSF